MQITILKFVGKLDEKSKTIKTLFSFKTNFSATECNKLLGIVLEENIWIYDAQNGYIYRNIFHTE